MGVFRRVSSQIMTAFCAVQARAGLPWRKRWPRWLLVERVSIQAMWRASQAAFKPWSGPDCLLLPPKAVSSTSKASPCSCSLMPSALYMC